MLTLSGTHGKEIISITIYFTSSVFKDVLADFSCYKKIFPVNFRRILNVYPNLKN